MGTLEIADDVAFGHVADGLPDAVGGSASTHIGEVGKCIPRGWIAAVDVVADEPHGSIHHQNLNAIGMVTGHQATAVWIGTWIYTNFALIRPEICAAHRIMNVVAISPKSTNVEVVQSTV